jgi:uncharacterized protein YciI
MYFLIESFDAEGVTELRAASRAAHLQYLTDNVATVLAAGAKLNDAGEGAGGSIYIVDVGDRAAAEAFLSADPFMRAGVIDRWTITRWRKGFFDHRRVPQEEQ